MGVLGTTVGTVFVVGVGVANGVGIVDDVGKGVWLTGVDKGVGAGVALSAAKGVGPGVIVCLGV